jgi:hypothetical protein
MSNNCPPVLFIIYRRPETTRKVFEAIRQARPAQLFISQEARPIDRPDQFAAYDEARAIATAVDWPCEVHTLFFETHQGIIKGFNSAFDWFFDHVEEGIMLEDDQVPDQTFFPFCAEMLEKYRDDERVMSISGSNVLQHYKKPYREYSYYFLSVPSVWGMATWRRAWKHYDPYIKDWPKVRDSKLLYEVLPTPAAAFYFSKKFEDYYNRKINSYDGQWVFACLANKGLTIYASTNLISNIGVNSANAFHANTDQLWANVPLEPLPFPLKHPPEVAVNKMWDEYGVGIRYSRATMNWYQKIKWHLKAAFPDLYLAVKRTYYKLFRSRKYVEYNDKNERLLLK